MGRYTKKNFANFVNKHSLGGVIASLPRKEKTLAIFNECLGIPSGSAWAYIFVHVMNSKKSKCYNFYQCDFDKINADCVNVVTSWTHSRGGMSDLDSVYQNAEFQENDYCTY